MYEIRTTNGFFWAEENKPEDTRGRSLPHHPSLETWEVAKAHVIGTVDRTNARNKLRDGDTMFVQLNPNHIVAIIPLG